MMMASYQILSLVLCQAVLQALSSLLLTETFDKWVSFLLSNLIK